MYGCSGVRRAINIGASSRCWHTLGNWCPRLEHQGGLFDGQFLQKMNKIEYLRKMHTLMSKVLWIANRNIWSYVGLEDRTIRSNSSRIQAHEDSSCTLRGVRRQISVVAGTIDGIFWNYVHFDSAILTSFTRLCWNCSAFTSYLWRLVWHLFLCSRIWWLLAKTDWSKSSYLLTVPQELNSTYRRLRLFCALCNMVCLSVNRRSE